MKGLAGCWWALALACYRQQPGKVLMLFCHTLALILFSRNTLKKCGMKDFSQIAAAIENGQVAGCVGCGSVACSLAHRILVASDRNDQGRDHGGAAGPINSEVWRKVRRRAGPRAQKEQTTIQDRIAGGGKDGLIWIRVFNFGAAILTPIRDVSRIADAERSAAADTGEIAGHRRRVIAVIGIIEGEVLANI